MEDLSRVPQNQKRKKKHYETEFLLLFNGCRKVLGKIPPLFNDPDVLSSVSDKAKLFARHFFKN